MKNIIITIALFFIMTTSALAAELIMFSMASCGYCQNFLKEVAPTYADTEAAKLLPLRIISMDRKTAPKWFDQAYKKGNIDGVVGTPTFIVFDSGEEKARLIGYQGKDRFFDDINRFIDSNRVHLQRSSGKSTIPYEEETEVDYKTALIQDKKVMHEGSHHEDEKKVMPHENKKLPNGVINSNDIFDHIYKTRKEAEIAAMWIGCGNEVHTHEMPDGDGVIWMPCAMK